ncbi:LOW QUALITY PROTEIN: receptor-like protein 7 [Vigna unguiculata]|uniref:LOW QUALITY PROTEIN: receptor-like protein 7 n=1 Tax=Vigna unguiculata TaxID=3917 RepID=UPI001016FC29|nr:LOW QUALITY PROTEIN: receptor-like protein 7 [Vigna unguiculata]
MGWVLLSYFFMFHCLVPSYNCLLCNPDDKSALLQFKDSVVVISSPFDPESDPCSSYSSKTKSWNNVTDCCGWDGITCDSKSGHVIGLDLSCSLLRGELLGSNSSIFKLRQLQQLNLDYNDFFGSPIHSAIGDLVHLRLLSISGLNISGDVPSTISHLSKLLLLDISSMDWILGFSSKIRLGDYTWNRLIHNATNVRQIFIHGVNMSCVGERSLSLLTNLSSSLISLYLTNTQIQGKLSTDILRLPSLQEIDLSLNENLRGELPNSNWTTPLTSLSLFGTAFSGHIPNSITHLKSLYSLQLWGCYFDGFLPPSLFNLTQLDVLDFSDNKLVGPIPTQITKLPKLLYLYLSGNMLNGSIPFWCYSFPSLWSLDLSHNQLTGSIGEFSANSLESLSLSNNNLQGNFPTSIFQLQNLSTLDLSSMNLSGVMDFHQFSKLKVLNELDLSHNIFLFVNFENNFDCILPNLEYLYLSSSNVNSFPKFLAPLQNLRLLDLSHNRIRGSIPKWFHENLLRSWKNISSIDLSFNKLQGDLPIPPNGTKIFLVSNNELSGEIPSSMCNTSTLSILNMAHNNLTGLIPQCLGTFPYLWALDLQENNLYGSLPLNFSKGNAFGTIKLNGNHLQGPVPRSFTHCTTLEVLDLGNNNIEDTFPYWLETLPNLQVLSLRSNKFHGIITSLGTKLPFPRLRIFDISNNYFTGLLPTSYIHNFQGMMDASDNQTGLKYLGNDTSYNDSIVIVMKGYEIELKRILTVFTTIDLSNNMFEGEVPKVIGELHSLKGLNLSHNRITGTIPLSLGNLSNLEWLDLSWNQLKGEIPMVLKNLNFLAVLNLSQNQFEGVIPTGGQFNTFENDSYAGNPKLCGIPLSKQCKEDNKRLSHSALDEQVPGFGWKVVVVGYACGMIFGIILGYSVLIAGKPQWLARLVEAVYLIPDNKLVGPIPTQITKLPKLLYLYLSGNMLNGSITFWCYSFPSLLSLDLSHNQLTGSIGEFSANSLEFLSLSNNNLQGNFPTSIFQLQNLTYLSLSSTNLSGTVDFHQFVNFENHFDCILPNLEYLYLSSSNVISFPKFLATLQNLRVLDLSHNKIRGSIPKWFQENLLRSWKNMSSIDLSFNKLQGDLPIPPNGTKFFLVSNNELSGEIPSAMCDTSTLSILNLAHNNLTGLIPQCLGTFSSLWALDLQNNNLYGSLPLNFSKGNAFRTIKLNGNHLQGPVPRSLTHCTTLEVLDLGNNNIEDTFPYWLETLPNLQVLSLRSNKFHGVITFLGTKLLFPKLRIFDISNNYFTGLLPTSYIHNFRGMMDASDNQTGLKYLGNNTSYDSVVIVMKGNEIELKRILTIFTTIDLSNNMFEGEVPKVIGELHSLIGLNLSHNRITGTIPMSLGNLSNLEWLDLSWNHLKGEIPMALTNLNFLAVLNLSGNQFEGMIPTGGQFNTFENYSYAENPLLCGIPLSKPCKEDNKRLSHSALDEKVPGFGWKVVVVGYACGMIFGIILGYSVLFAGKPQWLARLVECVFDVKLITTNNKKHVTSFEKELL